jgi:hypothetical protein
MRYKTAAVTRLAVQAGFADRQWILAELLMAAAAA